MSATSQLLEDAVALLSVRRRCFNVEGEIVTDGELVEFVRRYRRMREAGDLDPLPWTVLVNASGGWAVLAAFVEEGAAWSYGSKQLEARVRKNDECLGHKNGYVAPWCPCDRSGPCA